MRLFLAAIVIAFAALPCAAPAEEPLQICDLSSFCVAPAGLPDAGDGIPPFPEPSPAAPKAGKQGRATFLPLLSGSFGRQSYFLDRIRGQDCRGLRISGKETGDINLNQSHWCETSTLDLLSVGLNLFKKDGHLIARVFVGMGRQRIIQSIGPGSFFKSRIEPREDFSALTDWGVQAGAEFEYASTDPVDPLEVAVCNPITVLAIFCFGLASCGKGTGPIANPFEVFALLGGFGKRDSMKAYLTEDLRCLFGFSLGCRYLDACISNERLFGRVLSGSWDTSEVSVSFFTGLYVGRWGVLKVGGEWLGSRIAADLAKRGSGPESIYVREELEGSGWGVFAEFKIVEKGLPGFFLKATSRGSMTLSAGIGWSI